MALTYTAPSAAPPDLLALLAGIPGDDLRCIGQDVRSMSGPCPEKPLYLYLDGVSVRTVALRWAGSGVEVELRSLACEEEHRLALALVAAAARLGSGTVVCDEQDEPVSVDELMTRETPGITERMERDLWAIRDTVARDGLQKLSGPRRHFCFGPQVLAWLGERGPEQRLGAVHARMRRVQYLSPSVYPARFSVNPSGRTAMVLGPGVEYLFQRADAIHVYQGPTVPFDALESLIAPARIEWLDDDQVLVPATTPEAWPALMERARVLVAEPSPSPRPWWRFWGAA